MPTLFLIFILLTTTITTTTTAAAQTLHHNRRILHQPYFFPTSQPPSQSPQPQPQNQQPKYPFSSQTPPISTPQQNFFPFYTSPPPPPSTTTTTTTTTTTPTFPANISSLSLPQTSSISKPISKKLLTLTISLSLIAALLAGATVFFLCHRKHHQSSFLQKKDDPRSDSLRLFPPNTATSDGAPPPPAPPRHVSTTSSSEFLYLGTLVNSTGIGEEEYNNDNIAPSSSNAGKSSPVGYRKLGSPELHPLPPLPRQNFGPLEYQSSGMGSRELAGDDEDDEFFSPRTSSVGKVSPEIAGNGYRREFPAVEAENLGNRSSNSRTTSYPSNSVSPSPSLSSSPSILFNLSPRSLRSKSPDSIVNFPAPARPIPPPPPRERKPRSPSPPSSPPERTSGDTQNSPARFSDVSGWTQYSHYVPVKLPPPPPPLPPARYWETPATRVQDSINGPPVLSTPSNSVQLQNPSGNFESEERNVEILKPKLKPLHWDKVRASSDRAMVWDQLKSSSFQLNEEMIETLFMVNSSNLTPKDNTLRPVLAAMNQENRVLDPKKSQNIAILLRALNVTIDEVCETLLEGNTDTLGTELLESLLKMAPTKEEEHKLKEFKDESPFKLGPAEKFLKAVLDVPFAFKRIDAMLYIANFDSEVEYLKRSIETLEAACEELRNNRMFMKLLEAVLKTGNRMNVGTNRGDAHAFKLDTLLKLVDVKGTDGKTTLLHFVVQEIIRSKGSRISSGTTHDPTAQNQQSTYRDDVEFRKLGLQVVSSLSGELSNVKKSAAMDSNILTTEVTKLASGISKIEEVVQLNEESALKENGAKFSSSMNVFLKNAKVEIIKVQARERVALSMVKEITEYFHGNSAKEAHPCRIFMVVRDFLCVLDQVCKEVGKINERTIVNSARQFPLMINAASHLPVFPVFNGRDYSSSDEESSSSST